MPIALEIHVINVGCGDSSVIAIRDTTSGEILKNILIDLGEDGSAAQILTYLEAKKLLRNLLLSDRHNDLSTQKFCLIRRVRTHSTAFTHSTTPGTHHKHSH